MFGSYSVTLSLSCLLLVEPSSSTPPCFFLLVEAFLFSLHSLLLAVSFLLSCPYRFLLVAMSTLSSPCCPLHVASSYSCVSRLGEPSLIGGASADRLTNSLFINGLSVPGSQRSQRTIQFSSIDFMSPCRAIFITGIKTLIKDKK